MEIAGAGYLYTLATISITYTGFAALTIILRQGVGGRISDFDAFFISSVVVRGFLVATGSLLPLLLALLEISEESIWRLCSFITATMMGVFLLVWWVQRRRVTTSAQQTKFGVISYVGQWVAAIFLFAISTNAIFSKATLGMFSTGLTAFLVLGFVLYFTGLRRILRGNSRDKKSTSARTKARSTR